MSIDWATLNLNGQQNSAFQNVKSIPFGTVMKGMIKDHSCRMHDLTEFKRSYEQKSRETLFFNTNLTPISNYQHR